MRKNIILTTTRHIISFDKCEYLERRAKQNIHAILESNKGIRGKSDCVD